jgi:UDP-N-acetylmuramoyl-tripeptide--D-alanyl-D-alanine ligase
LSSILRNPFWAIKKYHANIKRKKSSSKFVAVTGSSGKSTTVSLLAHIIEGTSLVKSQSLQNTIGPLIKTLRRHQKKDLFVVAELGVGDKGQMAPMAEIFKPDVAILTMIGDEHYSSFRGKEGVFEEKSQLFHSLKSDGLAILNGDDSFTMNIVENSLFRNVTFGRNNSNSDYIVQKINASVTESLTFIIKNKKNKIRIHTQFPGEQFWLPITAAVVAALELGIPVKSIIERVATFNPIYRRCSIHSIQGGPCFILDCIKAPYSTLNLAFDMVKNIKNTRRRIVIGNISDYAGSQSPKYKNAYKYARECADQVIFIGQKETSIKPCLDDIKNERVIFVQTPKEAFEYIKKTTIPNEVILVKSSGNLHLERLMLAFKKKVLCWEPACKINDNCLKCPGLGNTFNRREILRNKKINQIKLNLFLK